MKIYKHRHDGTKITEDTYDSLMLHEQYYYEYIGRTNGNKSNDDLLLSGIIGYAINSGIIGGLLGGNLLGGILGDALNDDDDNPFW